MTEAMAVLAGLRLADGRSWGSVATEWQLRDAEQLLRDSEPRSSFLTRPRGGDKTTGVAGVLVSLLVTGRLRGDAHVWAVDGDQARLLLQAARGLVERTVELSGAVKFEASKMRSPIHGGCVTFMAADAGGSFGLRSEFLVLDELAAWPETPTHTTTLEAVVSTRSKIPGCRLVIVTSAGDPSHFSYQLLEHARSTPKLWYVSEIEGPLPWLSAEELADQRQILPEPVFKRLHLNEWVSGEDALASWDDLQACVVLDGPTDSASVLTSGYAMGLDVGLKRDATVLAVMHRSDAWAAADRPLSEEEEIDRGLALDSGRPWTRSVPENVRPVFALDELHVWEPSRLGGTVNLGDVEQRVVEMHRKYRRAKLRFDPWQAQHLAQRVRAEGVTVQEQAFTSSSVGRIALPLFQAIRERRLQIFPDEALVDELAHVQLRESSPGVFRLDHRSGRHDDRAVAIALAMVELLTLSPEEAPPGCWVDRRLFARF